MSTAIVIARNTVSEAFRRKILQAFAMVALVMICLTFAFQSFAFRQELTLIKGMGLGIISLAGIFISVILCINLIPTEIERRTIYTILSKPVRRHEFLLGKYFGALYTVLINIAAMGIVFVIAVAVKQAMGGGGSADLAGTVPDNPLVLFKGVLMIYMQLLLLCSLAIFFSTFLTPLINFFLTLALYVVGNLSSLTQDLATNNKNVLIKGFFTAVHYLVPNFGNFQLQNPLLNPGVVVKSEAILLTQNVLYAVVYSAVLIILAILIFDRREV